MQEKTFIIASFIVFMSLLVILLGFITTVLLAYKKKQFAFIREFEKSQLEMQEETLRSISRELHDNVGSQLSLSRLYLTTAALNEDHPATSNISAAAELIEKILDEVRDVSRNLSLDVIRNQGLVEAIRLIVDQLASTGAYRIGFNVLGQYNYMDEQKEVILFRIFQEAINNIIRHAEATSITVIVDCSIAQVFRLCIIDNGKGFEVEQQISDNTGRGGSGLRNMQMRCRVLAANFSIKSISGKGTTIEVQLIT